MAAGFDSFDHSGFNAFVHSGFNARGGAGCENIIPKSPGFFNAVLTVTGVGAFWDGVYTYNGGGTPILPQFNPTWAVKNENDGAGQGKGLGITWANTSDCNQWFFNAGSLRTCGPPAAGYGVYARSSRFTAVNNGGGVYTVTFVLERYISFTGCTPPDVVPEIGTAVLRLGPG